MTLQNDGGMAERPPQGHHRIYSSAFYHHTVNQEMFTNDLFGEFRVPIKNAKFNSAKPFEIY